MAGHIKRRTVAANLDKIGEHVLLEKIASGKTMAGLARELGIGNLSLYHWIRKDPDREERFKQARRMAADIWAEECLDIADTADSVSANVARLQVETRKWLASVANPDTYSPKSQAAAQINLNFNQMHLDALRQLRLSGGDVSQLVDAEALAAEAPKQVTASNLDTADIDDSWDFGDDT